MAQLILFLIFVIVYSYGEGTTEAISHEWKDGIKKRNPYEYHAFRIVEAIGIIGMVIFYCSIYSILLIPLYVLVMRGSFCYERKEFPLIKTIGKQGEGQSGIYRISLIGKKFDIKFPSTITIIVSSMIGVAAYLILAGGK